MALMQSVVFMHSTMVTLVQLDLQLWMALLLLLPVLSVQVSVMTLKDRSQTAQSVLAQWLQICLRS